MSKLYVSSVGVVALLLLASVSFARLQDAGPLPPAASPSANRAQPQSSPPASGHQPTNSKPTADSPSKDAKIVVPVGTHIPLILHNAISTRTARPGDPVYFETSFPVMLNGRVVIPAGSYVSGEVTEAKRPGRVHGRGQLMIRLTTMILPNSYMVALNAVPGGSPGTGGNESVDSEGKIKGDSSRGSDAGTVIQTTAEATGIGTAVGAASGDIGRGAGIGAGVGAVAGLAAVLLTRGPEAELPRGTTLDAVLDRPIYLDASKDQFTSPGQSTALPGPADREPRRYERPF
ncbi:MAG: hypothetical protein KGL02_03450 [Acidobacteriota bacterium]|nr:hypothetical protein [Acidobacteriota bacterium]MDE3169603.1 hypothetical protein [Acidobacteriota bacterium]